MNLEKNNILFGLLFVLLLLIEWTKMNSNKKKYTEAKICDVRELRKYANKIEKKNIIVSKNIKIDPHSHLTANLNQLIIGSAGKGKSANILATNLLCNQGATKFVSDVGGKLYHDFSDKLKKEGYKIKVLDLNNFSSKDQFNPLYYLKNSKGKLLKNRIVSFAEAIDIDLIDDILKIIIPDAKGKDNFFNENTRGIAKTIILLICYHPGFKDKRNLITVVELFSKISVFEDEENKESDLERIFQELERQLETTEEDEDGILHAVLDESKPASIVIKRWNQVRNEISKSDSDYISSVKGSFSTHFDKFLSSNATTTLSKDTMNLDRIENQKTVYFIITNESTRNFDYISSMFYECAYQMTLSLSLKNNDQALKNPATFLLDEFGQIYIPTFDRKISTMRKHNIYVMICLQALSQLYENYGENASETIISNCAILNYLGTDDLKTKEFISKLSGECKEILNSESNSFKSSSRSSSEHFHALLTINDLNALKKYHSYIFINGRVYYDQLLYYSKLK